MFDVANDRLSYGELLRPDVGYTLDFAVGTTYSLDLEALLGVPVSLGLLGDADAEQMRSPLYVLEAIRTSSDKIAIFCNAGGIKLPDKIQSVYSLLEESVFQVKLSTGNSWTSWSFYFMTKKKRRNFTPFGAITHLLCVKYPMKI